mmetsp:Transcript_11182/g.26138  ORF Transcript_11182/g.26138 Transcript_11182/m.26138 type:complete len:195 (+) Transcript_11182:2-586(+)
MGGTSSVQLSDRHVEEIMANTDFDRKQVLRLWKRFNLLDAQGKGYISKSDFDYLPELANNPMADRILQCLGDGSQEEGEAAAKEASNRKQKPDEVDFATFVRALDCFSPYATPKRKLDLMYRLYDFDGDGLISREDMTIAMDRVIGLGATKWPPPACQGAGGHLPPPPCACACDSRRFPILDGHLDRSSRLLSL